MHVRVWKEGGHLRKEALDEDIGLVPGGVERDFRDAKFTADTVGSDPTGELGVGDEPGRGVAGHLKLGHYANAPRAGVGDKVADLVLRVEEPIRAKAGELGVELGLDAEALVFGEVPVKDVELHGSHGVEVALEDRDRFKMAAAVDHQTSPAKTGRVVNRHGGEDVAADPGLDELKESLQAVQGANRGSGGEMDSLGRNGDAIGLVLVQSLNSLARVLNGERERCRVGAGSRP